MVYGAEVVLPADIAFRSARVNEVRELEVNSAEEKWLDSCIRTAKYLVVLRRYYNKNIKEWFFVVGDLVSTNSRLHRKGPS